MKTKLNKLLQDGRTIFTLDDLSVIWGQKNRRQTSYSAKYYAKIGDLRRIRRGVYAVNGRKLSEYEIANKLIAPSYVSGETVLALKGVTFQFTGKIFSMAANNKTLSTKYGEYVYRQLRKEVLFNEMGIEDDGGVLMACLERAMLDLIYTHKGEYPFEYVEMVNWGKLKKISKIYRSKIVDRVVKKLIEENEND
ncbi:MAG: hypothetical protein LBL08_00285 [Candidatus Nomurabacteria bacterium]|jgi:predicted transcriptional regulator of viral defense system|nr:hypothetical protein [Candidatus Nomurabacteria bacterium]